MKYVRGLALGFIVAVYVCSLWPGLLAGTSYDMQHREHVSEPPGQTFLLGTDELGRDRFARLLYGLRTSLILAPAAAMLSTALATIIGVLTASFGGRLERLVLYIVDVFNSTPWLFLLLLARAFLPLNVSAWFSVGVTFALLGLLGWAPGVRVIAAAMGRLTRSDFLLQARAMGCQPRRLLLRHSVPNLAPVVLAQFWLTTPIFVLAEANLSMLGLGVTEFPSLGNLITELQNYSAVIDQPWLLAPALVLFAILAAFQFVFSKVS